MRNTNSSAVPIEIACHSDGIRKSRIGFKVLNATSCVYFSFLRQSENWVYLKAKSVRVYVHAFVFMYVSRCLMVLCISIVIFYPVKMCSVPIKTII